MTTNPNISKFVNKQNLKLLWDVLLDEFNIDINNKQLVSNIRTVFDSNIQPFTKNTSANSNGNVQLVNLNKQFLSQVVIAVNRLFPNLKQEQEFKRIQISSEEIIEPYKVEDIHSERQNKFEKQVQQKRVEFEKSINLNKPAEVDFSEKIEDDKIKEMDALIAETVARRKFDIEQIQHNLNTEDPENWLQPQQTQPSQLSQPLTKMKNKNEVKEQVQVKSEQNFSSGIYRKLKLKQIDTNVNVNVNVPKKNVTWTDQKPTNTNMDNLSLLIEELSPIEEIEIEKKDKIDILTNKVDILIDLMTKLTKQLSQQGN
jgi:hypothetical protein